MLLVFARRLVHAFAALLLTASLAPAPLAAQTPASDDPLSVVASFSILGDLARQVGGDAVHVSTLVGPGVDAHTYDPAPADLVALSEADIVFEIGLGFEPWLDNFYASAQPPGERVVVSEGITPREGGEHDAHESEAPHEDDEAHADDVHANDEEAPAEGEEREEGETHADDADREYGAYDPHVWHDVANAIVMTENIRDALVAADPANAALYEANAAAFIAELEALDAEIRAQIETLPEERRRLVTSHDTFGYFADAYGFEVVGTALGSLSTEVADPSAQEIVRLVAQIEAAGVPAIFAENVANPDLMAAIAAEAGVALAPPLYTDALGPEGSPGESYVGMMRANVEAIVDALGG